MRWNDISLKVKLTSLFLILSLAPMIILGVIVYNNASDALKKEAFNKLTSVRETKGRQIESYFQQIHDQILTLSEDIMVAGYASDLKKAFWNIDQGISESEYQRMENSVRDYYQNEYLSRLNKNIQRTKLVSDYWPNDRESIILQYYYLSNNPNPTGEKHKLNDAEDGSEYSRLHSIHHPIIKNYLEKFGYYDIFLADPNTGNIFYTVFKEVDFTTNIVSGPYSHSSIATAFKRAASAGRAGNKDYVTLGDFEPYDPSYHAPASFIASPVITQCGEFVAVLLFQMPVDKINSVMTGNEGWEEDGLGKSGETYLVGSDYKMRSISRFYIQDKKGLFGTLNRSGVKNKSLPEQMELVGTTIGLMKVKTEASISALNGVVDTKIIEDYRGIPVLSAFRKLKIEGLEYAILSEIDKTEAFAAVNRLKSSMVFIGLCLVVFAVICGILIAKSISKPIFKLKNAADKIAGGDLTVKTKINSKDEIGSLANSFDFMAESLIDSRKNIQDYSIGLEKKVKERTEKLESANKRLMELDREKDELLQEALKSKKKIRQSLSEKEVLLREIHHRVKNNMQMIQSLLNLQAARFGPDFKAFLTDTNSRIRSMALVHEILYRSDDIANLDLGNYFRQLVKHLAKIYLAKGKSIETVFRIESVTLDMDASIACGLMLNELVTNAFKYAFQNSPMPGVLEVGLQMIDHVEVELSVSDNGVGLPETVEMDQVPSLGLKIVSMLAEDQLHGRIVIGKEAGTRFRIIFPLS